jgi:tetratricopeptide (TPR) repeat protein
MSTSPKSCRICGEPLTPGADFCRRCGNPITTSGYLKKYRKHLLLGGVILATSLILISASLHLKSDSETAVNLRSLQAQLDSQKGKIENNPGFWTYEGYRVSMNQSKQEAAIEDYGKALEADPKYHEALTRMGDILFRQGRYNESIHYFETITNEVDPGDKDAWFYLGRAYYSINRPLDAIQNYDEAIQLNNKSCAKIYQYKSQALQDLKRDSDAKEALAKAGTLMRSVP